MERKKVQYECGQFTILVILAAIVNSCLMQIK